MRTNGNSFEFYSGNNKCSHCLYYQGKSRFRRYGCPLKVCCCEKENRDTAIRERTSGKGGAKWIGR